MFNLEPAADVCLLLADRSNDVPAVADDNVPFLNFPIAYLEVNFGSKAIDNKQNKTLDL